MTSKSRSLANPQSKVNNISVKTIKILRLIALIVLPASCAFHEGMMNDSASLHGRDFELIGVVEGKAQTIHVLGIGGLDPAGLVAQARRKMYNSYPLKKGQAYANISVDFKRSFYFVVNTTMAIVTADVVQFGEEESSELQELFKNGSSVMNIIQLNNNLNMGIMVNEDLRKVYILEVKNGNRYTVVDSLNNTYPDLKKSMLYDIRKGAGDKSGKFKVGDTVKFRHWNKSMENFTVEKTGVVIGIADKAIAIRSESEIFQVSPNDVIEVSEK